MNQYLYKIDSPLETHAPLKKLNKSQLKFLTKSWITNGLQNSIKKKKNICSKFVKCKNQNLKEFLTIIARPTEKSLIHTPQKDKIKIFH